METASASTIATTQRPDDIARLARLSRMRYAAPIVRWARSAAPHTVKPTDVFDLLAARDPVVGLADGAMLYGQFVGSWTIESTWFKRDGAQRTARGEWHFAWILGGCGVQDVLFAAGSPPERRGTTLRCYDTALDAWHITWMHPASGEFVNLLGRKVGERIVQETLPGEARRLRWSFNEITPTSFIWRGEVSEANGATWFLEQEMHATRRPARQPGDFAAQ
jgi:hypothetical protein